MILFKFLSKLFNKKRYKSVVFYKDADGCWYADLHGVPKVDCVMIEGSDVFLDKWSEYLKSNSYRNDRFGIRVYTEHIPFYLSCLRMVDKDVEGYTYIHSSGHDNNFNATLSEASPENESFKLWICKCIEFLYQTPPTVLYLLPDKPIL